MAEITNVIKVDCSIPNRFVKLSSKQADVSSRFLSVQITNNNENISVDATDTVIINCERADGQKRSFSGTVNQDGTVTVPVPNWLLEKEGNACCDISVLDTNNVVRLTTLAFSLYIEKVVNNTSEPSPDDPSDVLIQILNELDEKVDIDQGVENAGKVLGINEDGEVEPVEGGSGTPDYENLRNKPSINGTILTGNKVSSQLGLQSAFTIDGSLKLNNGQLMVNYSDYINGEFTKPNFAPRSKDIVTLMNGKQNSLTAGAGISIANDVISATTGLTITVVEELPQTGNAQTIYLVSNDGSGQNIYDEYIYVNNAWEKIGTTDIDLSDYVTNAGLTVILSDYVTDTELSTALAGYATSSALTNGLATKQDVFTVGENLSLSNGTLSALDYYPTYVASLPVSGTSGVTYCVPQDLPSIVKELIQKAYEEIGDLSNYPRFIEFDRSNGRQCVLLGAATSKNSYNGGTLGGGGGILVVKQNGSYTVSSQEYMNHPDTTINYANTDLYNNIQTMASVTFEANVSSDISYASGTNTPTTAYDCYVWRNNGFTKIGTMGILDLLNNSVAIMINNGLATKQDTLVSGTNIKTINSTSLLGSGDIAIPQPLVFSNLSVATTDWVADSTYTDYGYKAVLTCSGVTASMEADVYLSSASASLGVVASFCDEGTDSVTIYSTSNENAITIDKVVAS